MLYFRTIIRLVVLPRLVGFVGRKIGLPLVSIVKVEQFELSINSHPFGAQNEHNRPDHLNALVYRVMPA